MLLLAETSFFTSDSAKIGAVFAALLVIGAVFQQLRAMRAALADEIRRELNQAKQVARVDVQSPLEFKHASEFVTKAEHTSTITEIKDELKRHAARRAEIYDGMKEHSGEMKSLKATNVAQSELLGELRTDLKVTSSKVDTVIGEQRQLNQQLHQVVIAIQAQGHK